MSLQGAGQAAAEGARQQQAGIQSIIGGLGTAAELGLKYAPLYGKDKVDPDTMSNMIDIGGDTSQISPAGPTAANRAGYMGPYTVPQYGPFQAPASLPNDVSPFMQQSGFSRFGGGEATTPFMQQLPSTYSSGIPAYGDRFYQNLLGF